MGKIITGECVDYTFDGKGIVKGEGVTVFVNNLIKGEIAKIEIIKHTNNQTIGRIKEIIKPSNDRVKPKCKICHECGGCVLQHMNYSKQLEFKKEHVNQCLKKIGNLNVSVSKMFKAKEIYEYRNKTQVPFGMKKGKVRYGFYRENSHEIIPFNHCLIETKIADDILLSIKNIMEKYKIDAYDEDTRKGIIRHVLVRVGYYSKQVMVVIVSNVENFHNRKDLVKELLKEYKEIKTIVQNVNKRDTNVILGEKDYVLFGKGYIEDSLLGVTFKISAKSFYQINPLQTEVLYSRAIELANLTKEDRVLDAYCGIGTIGLIASKYCKEVVGVEIVKEAIIDANNNARNNNITNASFLCEDASKFMQECAGVNDRFDVCFIDPPRKGLDNKFIESIMKLAPKKIVYISCNPSTLARDLAYLKELYDIKEVNAVDLFPNSYHVECVVMLSKVSD